MFFYVILIKKQKKNIMFSKNVLLKIIFIKAIRIYCANTLKLIRNTDLLALNRMNSENSKQVNWLTHFL